MQMVSVSLGAESNHEKERTTLSSMIEGCLSTEK
jgi:hypothetical protein